MFQKIGSRSRIYFINNIKLDLEYRQSSMTDREKTQEIFGFIDEPDMEAASNSYLMSVVTVIVGIPLPIINLITTLVFLFANKRRGYFV